MLHGWCLLLLVTNQRKQGTTEDKHWRKRIDYWSKMPKQQELVAECVPLGISKHAKDQRNRASQSAAHRKQQGREPPQEPDDSERDSGYSESGSESLQRELHVQSSSMEQSARRNSSGASGARGARVLGRAVDQDVAPGYVIKNLLVKPSSPLLCGWNSRSAAEETPTQLLVIQPGGPASSPSSSLPQSQRRTGGEASKNSYLPILNSYPRIAPHPRQESSEQERGSVGAGGVKQRGGLRQTKRVRTEERRETVSTSQQREGRPQHQASSSSILRLAHHSLGGASLSTQHRPHHRRPHSPSTLCSSSVGSVSSSQTSPPSLSSSQTSPRAADSPPHPASEAHAGDILSDSQSDCSSVRQRRFLNTTEMLSQSGLLAITLRTKDLQRQSAATERDIAQLRQHAHLLCLAMQASQHALGPGPSPMDTLLQAMDQSGCYSNMDWGQINTLQPPNKAKRGNETEREKGGDRKDNSQAPNFVSVGYHDDGTSPPSPLFAPSPAPPVLSSCPARASCSTCPLLLPC